MASVDEDTNCPICLEALDGEAIERTVCGHIYHQRCYDECAANRQTAGFPCPLCRHQLAAPKTENQENPMEAMVVVHEIMRRSGVTDLSPSAMLSVSGQDNPLSADEQQRLFMARMVLTVPDLPEDGRAAAQREVDGLTRKQEAINCFRQWQLRQEERERADPNKIFFRNGVLTYAWLQFEGRSMISRVINLQPEERKTIPVTIHTHNCGRLENTEEVIPIAFPCEECINRSELAGAINLAERPSQERLVDMAIQSAAQFEEEDVARACFGIFQDDRMVFYPAEPRIWADVARIEVFKFNSAFLR